MLEDIKTLLGISDFSKDNLLQLLIRTTTKKVLAYCNTTEDQLPAEVNDIITELVVIRYNKLGSEGLASESFSGVSQSFSDDIPDGYKKLLNSYRRLKTL